MIRKQRELEWGKKKNNKSILVESREYFPRVMALLTKEMEVEMEMEG